MRHSYVTDFASSGKSPSRSADAPSGAGSPASAKALSGVAGMYARLGGRAVVQRSVHDLASLQYQRMSAHAWPPSGTSRPIGSAMPHREQWATSNGRRRSSPCAAARSCSGPLARNLVVTDEACGAMIPPRGTLVTRPPGPSFPKPGRPTRDVNRQARSYQARSWYAKLAHTKPAHQR